MTLEKIRLKAQMLRAKTRRELLRNIALPVFAVGLSVLGIIWFHDTALEIASALSVAWALAGQYFLNRGMWAETLPGDSALSTGFEFYQREIERRRYLFHRVLLCSFGPMVLAVAVLLFPIVRAGIRTQRALSNMTPFLVLLVLWLASAMVLRMRGHHELEREIEELNDIKRENSL